MSDYFDIQVNGYGGVDYNQDDLTAEQLQQSCELLQKHQVAGILATIITDHVDVICHRVRRLAQLREEVPLAKKLIAGIHIEGPFINENPGYRGAHPVDAIHPTDESEAARMVEAGNGLVKLVTLAPERDPDARVTRWLKKQGVTVAAGHCDASIDDLNRTIDAGLTLYTHLGNGCPMQMHRHDNIVQRVLNLAADGKIIACFIADGAHVPFVALKNYLQLTGTDRTVFVTDAISAAGLGPGRYKISRWDLLIGEDMVARSPDGSHFVGAAITMPQSARNLETHLNLPADVVQKMMTVNPRQAVGC